MKLTNVALICCWLCGCCSPESVTEYTERQTRYSPRTRAYPALLTGVDHANEVVAALVYIKDPRTNLCFASYWGGDNNEGGPALAAVPCESIPAALLTTSTVSTAPANTDHVLAF